MKESLWQANTCPTIVLGDVDCVHEERDRATDVPSRSSDPQHYQELTHRRDPMSPA